MEIYINRIVIEHAPDVQRLSAQLGYPLSLTEIKNNIAEVAATKDHIALVAISNEIVVGWIHGFRCVFLETRPFVEIGGLVVDENYRSKGIGKKLMEEIKKWAIEQGVHEIRVRSNAKRKDAHRFYVSNGCTEIKEQKVFELKL